MNITKKSLTWEKKYSLSLVNQEKLLPPLHIQLSRLKQYIKALSITEPSYQYLSRKYPLFYVKLDEDVLTYENECENLNLKLINSKEKDAWTAFKEAVLEFLGNEEDPNYEHIVQNVLEKFEVDCYRSFKVHFLHFNLDVFFMKTLNRFAKNKVNLSTRILKKIIKRYQGRL